MEFWVAIHDGSRCSLAKFAASRFHLLSNVNEGLSCIFAAKIGNERRKRTGFDVRVFSKSLIEVDGNGPSTDLVNVW